MPLTPFIIALLKDNYLDYRRGKAAESGRISPEMQTRINVLNSQMAVRARIQPSQLTANNKMVVRQITLQKSAQRFDNQFTAKNALTAFLQPGSPHSKAHGLKDELDWLGGYAVAIAPPGTKWIPGPLKKVDKAMSKTTEDYDFVWGQNKDLVRGTLACRTNQDLVTVAGLVKKTCIDEFGMFLIKQDNQKSVRDKDGTMKAGYSGWNFVVQFKDHKAFAAEVQANTFDMLYGKHSKEEVLQYLNVSAKEYESMQARLKFPGGLGHALYDISDSARSKTSADEGNWARELALDYYDACRGDFRNQSTLATLNQRIGTGYSRLSTAAAKELWRHAIKGSEWTSAITL